MWKRTVAIALAVVLAGCTPSRPWGEVTDTDRHRYEVLRADQVFADLDVPVNGRPGEHRDWLLARGEVSAEVTGLADLQVFRQRGLRALDDADGSGWTVYRTECTGPPDDTTAGPPVLWTAWAYKITDGVSYLLKISSVTSASTYPVSGAGAVLIEAYAPHSDESPPDLIPEHPPAAPDSCIRADTIPAHATVQGLDVVFKSSVNRDSSAEQGATR